MLKIIPIGGIGEIGMNMILMNSGEDYILIDCGILFPPFQNLGVEVVVPDYKKFCNIFKNLKKVFITHGHEDHIGGLPYLLKESKVEVFAPRYASELIKSRCKRLSVKEPKINLIKFDEDIVSGKFSVNYIKVDHSIPDSACLFIRTPEANILYAADFRLNGKNSDLFIKKIKEICSKHKIDVLLSDSTNAEDEAESISEEEVMSHIDKYFSLASKKIIVTMFSSNVARINQIISLSKKYKKKLFITGNNLKNHINISRSIAYLEPDEGCIRPDKEIGLTEDKDIVVLCTGSQAEKNSAISKLANGELKGVNIEKDDLVIFSSSQIPGNEKPIMNVINKLSTRGAKIVYSKDFGIHCSGHANREELKSFIKIVKPKYFLPMHGEQIHLVSHIDIALEEGVSQDNCFILKSGDEFSYDGNLGSVESVHKIDRFYVDSVTGDLIDDSVISERMGMSEHGVLFLNIFYDKTGKPFCIPNIVPYGLSKSEGMSLLLKNIEQEIWAFCKNDLLSKKITDELENIKTIVKRKFRKAYGNRPEILMNMVEIKN
jgi:ribonuclease J